MHAGPTPSSSTVHFEILRITIPHGKVIPLKPTFTKDDAHGATPLVQLAFAEDLHKAGDLTSRALIDPLDQAEVHVVARQPGILAGSPVAEMVFAHVDSHIDWQPACDDGCQLRAGTVIARVTGSLQLLLAAERTALNFLTHLSGIATLTKQYVDQVAGTKAQVLDTRKTLPGWRRLEKYAVRCGGGTNHRIGLFDGILIKDNHLAGWSAHNTEASIAAVIGRARQFLAELATEDDLPDDLPVEVEVDTLEQLAEVLPAGPDIVLLDNMDVATLSRAVEMRDETAGDVLLEASGGVNLDTIAAIAATGVDRISVGALTHSAIALDIAFDWKRLL